LSQKAQQADPSTGARNPSAIHCSIVSVKKMNLYIGSFSGNRVGMVPPA
jgi:hypothetical protein